MLTRTRAAVLVVAGLSLAACGEVHPGAAAVVDGQTISLRTLDDTARAFCTLSIGQARQQGVTAISNTDVRRQAVTTLVSLVVARRLAEDEGLDVKPREYELTTAQRSQVAEAFPDDDVEPLVQAIEDSQEVSAIAVALAAKRTGTTPTPDTQAQLAEQGQAEITKAYAANDVSFSPRLGLGPSGDVRAASGTLSVAPADLEPPTAESLPDAQRCS